MMPVGAAPSPNLVRADEPNSRLLLLTMVWLATLVVAVLAALHSSAILPLSWETAALTTIQPFQGAGYAAPFTTSDSLAATELPYRLYEDRRSTRFSSAQGYDVVVRFGHGRFFLDGQAVYFSATDNSDPRTNGRQYSLRFPTPVPNWLLKSIWVIALVLAGVVAVRRLRPVLAFLAHPPFAAAALLFLGILVANRLWFFVDFPIVAIHPDSGTYYALAEQLGTGVWPNLGNRPPVYPLFLKCLFLLVDRVIAIAVAQTIVSTLAGLTLVYAAYRWAPWLGLPAAFAVALFMVGFTTLEHDTAMLSESLYTSFLMLSFAGLFVGLRGRDRGLPLAVGSTSMALATLTRPGGMFLLVSYLIIVAFLVWNRFDTRAIGGFVVPFPLLLALMSFYNLRVVGVFAPTTWGEANLAVATFAYWQTDPSYPPEINRDIQRIQGILKGRFTLTQKDRSAIYESWDPDLLGSIFVESFNNAALEVAQGMGGHYETAGRSWIRRIAFDAIRKHRGVYARFVWAMLYAYFKPSPDYDFRVYLQNRVWTIYVQRSFSRTKGNDFLVRLGKDLADGRPPRSVIVTSFDPDDPMNLQDRVVITPTRLWRLYELTHILRQRVFEYWFWSYAVFVTLAASTVVLVRSRARRADAFALFIMTLSAFGAGLVVSMVEYSQPRYSYPMEWVYGLSVVLLPLLFREQDPVAS